jgi:hypothetical protein
MKRSGTLPKGFTCHCEEVHQFPTYVFAHWNVELRMKCKCGRDYSLFRGMVSEIIQAKGLVKKCKDSI